MWIRKSDLSYPQRLQLTRTYTITVQLHEFLSVQLRELSEKSAVKLQVKVEN